MYPAQGKKKDEGVRQAVAVNDVLRIVRTTLANDHGESLFISPPCCSPASHSLVTSAVVACAWEFVRRSSDIRGGGESSSFDVREKSVEAAHHPPIGDSHIPAVLQQQGGSREVDKGFAIPLCLQGSSRRKASQPPPSHLCASAQRKEAPSPSPYSRCVRLHVGYRARRKEYQLLCCMR